ncbi:chromate transporter [Tissierella creatinophila]|uniref:Putative chromate transport protein n=1 Tax=Tissierella creatinophila DSM 6911 TaxID=1123403 RepID=A0A1U7M4E3_TISCR|nr:chromate transporter [Tissierella creatinophila]OLS02089.1 putative chromate transport protein [Tissierella creatinophila DSM 6911]
MKELLEMFWVFFRMGAFTFGGGYAMLPIIQEEIVYKRNWATDNEVIDYYAIGQCTPGIIAINTATFIGYKRKGIIGAIVATLGLVTPSIIIISIIAKFFKQFQEYKVVQHAFNGIQVVVVALITVTVVNMFKQSVKDNYGIILFLLAFIIIGFLKLSPIIVVVSSAIVGILRFRNREIEREK